MHKKNKEIQMQREKKKEELYKMQKMEEEEEENMGDISNNQASTFSQSPNKDLIDRGLSALQEDLNNPHDKADLLYVN